MIRNRSRAVTTKQALMPDQSFPSPSSQYNTKPISSFLGSPNYFSGFLLKDHVDTSDTMSPTSVLDTKPFMTTTTTTTTTKPPFFGYDKNHSKLKTPNIFSGNRHPWEELDPKGIGLALVDSMICEKVDEISSHSRKVLFGSKLNIQIPPNAFSPNESPKSPADFGIKTRNSVVVNSSLSPFGTVKSGTQTKECPGFLSASEMELSEDYTCVISHGPNPKTTIIYDDCIVESGCGCAGFPSRTSDKFGTIQSGCGGGAGFSGMKMEYNSISKKSNFTTESFLSFCYTCKKNLEQGKDIYIYRGEKAFCSSECRCQEMLFDEAMDPGI